MPMPGWTDWISLFLAGLGLIVAWLRYKLTASATFMGLVIGTVVFVSGKATFTFALLIFFLTSMALGHFFGGNSNQTLGPRNWVQVFANGGVSAIWGVLFFVNGEINCLIAGISAFAVANADTWATELGSTFGKSHFKITTFRKSVRGQSGAVSIIGLFASLLGSLAVSAVVPSLGNWKLFVIVALCGFLGSILDSLLGDVLQAKYRDGNGQVSDFPSGNLISGYSFITNDVVNFSSIAISSLTAYFCAAAWASL